MRHQLAALALVAGIAGPAQALVLDYPGIFNAADYGDVAGLLDVTHTLATQHWTTGYDDLVGVAWGGSQTGGETASVRLASVNGALVTLQGFDLGIWSSGRGVPETVNVFEIGNAVRAGHLHDQREQQPALVVRHRPHVDQRLHHRVDLAVVGGDRQRRRHHGGARAGHQRADAAGRAGPGGGRTPALSGLCRVRARPQSPPCTAVRSPTSPACRSATTRWPPAPRAAPWCCARRAWCVAWTCAAVRPARAKPIC